jgi:uncharacterized protein
MGLIIRSSDIHAAGCYTTAPITRGSRVVEYTGHHITKEVADVRYADSIVTYLFGIGDGSFVIDGHGTAMFINHSCDPNCETDEIDNRVWIVAIRDIAADEELTYDYNLYDGDDDDARCNCGAKNCRQTMYSPAEIRRRKRAAAKATKKKSGAGSSVVDKKKSAKKPATKRLRTKAAPKPAAKKTARETVRGKSTKKRRPR